MKYLNNPAEAQSMALAIVETIREPFLVLDEELRILAASRCFCEVFKEDQDLSHGRSLFELGKGQWDVPGLRQLLESVVPERTSVEGFEFERDFGHLGNRTMQINAHLIEDQGDTRPMVLLAIKDITSRRIAEEETVQLLQHTEELLEQQKTLLREMRHRIANSLQIIASILLLKASSVASQETKNELRDAHQRVMSVASVQSHLHDVEGIEEIDIGAYLKKLAAGLASSMIGPKQSIRIAVAANEGTLSTSHAVSIGLIATELVINAIKYAFPTKRASARIRVTFEMANSDWKLTVSDNGTGRSPIQAANARSGLGTALVSALAKQLEAQISEISTDKGLSVEVTRATFVSQLTQAA
ncbi:MAG TPA: histidine kinase dimerization/phosphoacceptor domain -containing protein [Sphingomicrobium sp.]|nr:histidine kinase dimerization/phosphoacceptor domain -containing protein [Sphingomicrobium sp.]